VRLFAVWVVVVAGGCDFTFGIDGLGSDGSQGYDRCAPGGYDDPLRYKEIAQIMSWDDARRACQLQGMDLAVFDDDHEMGRSPAEQWPYWIGVREDDATAWQTIDGCPPVAMPAPAAAVQCAAMFDALDPRGTSCDGVLVPPTENDPSAVQGVLCETPRPRTADCLPRDPATETYVVSPSAMSYATARAYCADRGQHLLEVSSQAELAVVSALVAGGTATTSFWIGATFDGTTWTAESACPVEYSWTDAGPMFAGDPLPNCAASVIAADPDSGAPALQGMAVARCDDTRHAICEQ
jgi:hypothetical protein